MFIPSYIDPIPYHTVILSYMSIPSYIDPDSELSRRACPSRFIFILTHSDLVMHVHSILYWSCPTLIPYVLHDLVLSHSDLILQDWSHLSCPTWIFPYKTNPIHLVVHASCPTIDLVHLVRHESHPTRLISSILSRMDLALQDWFGPSCPT